MFRARFHRLTAASVLLVATACASAAEVTIYRCTDAQSRLTLRDTPCRKGERQQTREMLRPTDPAPGRVSRAPAPVRASQPAPTRVIVVTTPRPLYECVTDDGERYTSDTAAGNLRWVPLAVLGYRVYPGGYYDYGREYGRGVSGRVDYSDGPIRGRIELGRPPTYGPPTTMYPPPIGAAYGYPAGIWIRDACHALPQQDVCSRLSDRRYELDRQYNSALQSERTRITTQQRGIDARLANDCGAY